MSMSVKDGQYTGDPPRKSAEQCLYSWEFRDVPLPQGAMSGMSVFKLKILAKLKHRHQPIGFYVECGVYLQEGTIRVTQPIPPK